MDKQAIFDKYHINDSHSEWDPVVDNWCSVEVCKLVLGRLPEQGDDSLDCAMKFLDDEDLQDKVRAEDILKFGSCYLTAKRMIYRYTDLVLDPQKRGK